MGKPYTVENQRPRRTLSLYGRTLAPKGRGRTSTLQLSEEELLGTPCVRLFQLKRLAIVGGDVPVELAKLLLEEGESPPTAKPSKKPKKVPSVEVVEPPAAEPTPVDEVPVEDEPPLEPLPEVFEDEVPPPGPSLGDTSYAWSESELLALNATDQKAICRSRDLKVSGSEADRVQRILDAQKEG